MKKKDLQDYLKKKVKLTLKNGYIYTATILDLSDTAIKIIDNTDSEITIALEEISIAKLENEATNGRT